MRWKINNFIFLVSNFFFNSDFVKPANSPMVREPRQSQDVWYIEDPNAVVELPEEEE